MNFNKRYYGDINIFIGSLFKFILPVKFNVNQLVISIVNVKHQLSSSDALNDFPPSPMKRLSTKKTREQNWKIILWFTHTQSQESIDK